MRKLKSASVNKGVLSKIKPIKITMKTNPEWKKQFELCKKELTKLSKMDAFIIQR